LFAGVVAVVLPSLFVAHQIQVTHQTGEFAILEQIWEWRPVVAFEVGNRGEGTDEHTTGAESFGNACEEIPVEIVEQQDEIPGTFREGIGAQIGEGRPDQDVL
jgi:hypothetical protein